MDLIRLTARFGKRYSGKIALVIVLQLVTCLLYTSPSPRD